MLDKNDPPSHPATLTDEELLQQCSMRTGRKAGPGGQHRNKVETAVFIRHNASGIEAHAFERRSQIENRRKALKRLRFALAVQLRYPVKTGDARSELWITRTCGGRISINPKHRDLPSLIAEAMDTIWACDLDIKKAAIRLCVTSSQLIKLLKLHPPALVALNKARSESQKHEIH